MIDLAQGGRLPCGSKKFQFHYREKKEDLRTQRRKNEKKGPWTALLKLLVGVAMKRAR